jgi:hypothetical protein
MNLVKQVVKKISEARLEREFKKSMRRMMEQRKRERGTEDLSSYAFLVSFDFAAEQSMNTNGYRQEVQAPRGLK